MRADYVFLCGVDVGAIRFRRSPPGTSSGTALRRSRCGISRQGYSQKKFNSAWHTVKDSEEERLRWPFTTAAT
jgi:hypothetical protein